MNRRAWALLAALVFVWGANWPIMKLGLRHIQPLWFASGRLGLGILVVLVVLACKGKLRLPSRADLPVILSVGLLSMGAFMALAHLALQVVPAGRCGILAYTTPLWVAPGATLFLGERVNRHRLIGLILGLAGITVLLNPQGLDWSSDGVIAANAMLLLAALAWAVAILHVRAHRWRASPLDLLVWQMLAAVIPITGLAIVMEGPPRPDGSVGMAWTLLYNGVLGTAFAFWASVTINRQFSAMTVSLALLCVPAGGIIFSALILGEVPSTTDIGGMILIAAGIAMTARAPYSE